MKQETNNSPTSMEVEDIDELLTGLFYRTRCEAMQAITRLIQQAEIRARIDEGTKVSELMKNIIDNDKTPAYDYPSGGKQKDVMNGQGKMPEGGQRWLTPTEMVRNYLRKAERHQLESSK